MRIKEDPDREYKRNGLVELPYRSPVRLQLYTESIAKFVPIP